MTIQWWHELYITIGEKNLTANNLDHHKKTYLFFICHLLIKIGFEETTEAGKWALINIFNCIEICKPSGVAVSLIIKIRKNRAKNTKTKAPRG